MWVYPAPVVKIMTVYTGSVNKKDKYYRFKKALNGAGFTLIELLVAISIIGILSAVGVTAFNDSRMKARDLKRKTDLRKIQNYLEQYYQDNKKYPPADTSSSSSCLPPVPGYGVFDGTYSVSTTSQASAPWITALAPYVKQLPQDPINSGAAPFIEGGNYTYIYGNVTCDGQSYDLIAQLENINDPDRCQIKGYFLYTGSAWTCTGPPNYSRYLIDYNNRE